MLLQLRDFFLHANSKRKTCQSGIRSLYSMVSGYGYLIENGWYGVTSKILVSFELLSTFVSTIIGIHFLGATSTVRYFVSLFSIQYFCGVQFFFALVCCAVYALNQVDSRNG